jgi:TP901 family phage tail tape measure protein
VRTLSYDGTLKFDTSIDTSSFQSGLNKISDLAKGAIKTTTAVISGAATGITGLGAAAIKVGASFEKSMSNVAAISGATGDELKNLTDKAKEMGAKTKFSASESADAFSYMAMAGWKTTDMLNGIEGIMNLAAASGEDLATTSDIVTDALTAFKLTAADSGHFADVLATASSNANTNVSLMGETFKYVAPVAGALGFSAEDCAVAIGLMANSGIKASQAGTSLRSIITRMAKPTTEVQSAMDALGLSLTKSDGSMKSLNEIMLDMREGFANLTQDQQAQMAASLGGQEAMSGLLAIVNASDDDFNKLTESIANCDGATAEMADTMSDNLPEQITILKSGLEGLGISLYEEMQAPLKDVVKEAQTMIQELQDAFNNGGLDSLVVKAGEVMAQIVTEVAQSAPKLIEVAENLVSSFINGIVAYKNEFASAGATMASELVCAIMDVTGDMWSAGIELFAEFLQGLTEHSEEIGQSFGKMISRTGGAVQENLPLIIQTAKDFIAGFCQGLSEEFPGVSALLDGFFDGFLKSIKENTEKILDIISKLFEVLDNQDPAALESIGEAIGTIASAIVTLKVAKSVTQSVKELFSVLGTFKGIASETCGVIGKIVEGFNLWRGGAGTLIEVLKLEFPQIAAVFSSIAGAVSKVIGFITEFGASIAGIGSIIAGAVLAVTNFVDMFVNGFNAIKEVLMLVGIALVAVGAVILGVPALVAAVVAGIVAAVATAVVLIKEHWDQIVEFFKSIPEKLSELGSAISEWFSGVLDSIGEFIDSAVEWFSELPGKIIEAISSLAESFVEWGASMLETASEVTTQIIDSIVQFFSELPYKIGYAIGFVIGTLASWGISALEWVTTTVPQIIEAIVNFFAELPGKIWNWLTNTYNNFIAWGSNMLQKAKEVASVCIESIIKFFSELPGKVWNWLIDTYNKFTTWGTNTLQKAKEIGSNTIESIIKFFSELPGRIWTWLNNTIQKIAQWGSDMVQKGKQAASDLCSTVIDEVSQLPGKMLDVGYNIVTGIWDGICNAGNWFKSQVSSFFSGIVDGVKDGLGIHSPSKVFADEIGRWIPPGIGVGIEAEMPDLYQQMDDEMANLGKRMQTAVNVETGKIAVDKKVSTTYKVEKEKQGVFESGDTTVEITGETHVHVDLDGREVGDTTTPIVDENMARIDTHKKRGG